MGYTCVNLTKSVSPSRIAENHPIANIQEISVALVVRFVHHYGILSITADVAKFPPLGVFQVASVEFLPELRSARDQAKHLTANSNAA